MAIEVRDVEFRQAIALIDAGNIDGLSRLLDATPRLLHELVPVAHENSGSYFANPKLLWFVAENPVRNGTLPANIEAVAEVIIAAARKYDVSGLKDDLDYTLVLVASGRVVRETGAQAPLIELLTREGADANGAVMAALGHGELSAAECLLACGAEMTLFLASGLGKQDYVEKLVVDADQAALQAALSAAAINAHAAVVSLLVRHGADASRHNPPDLHAHSTPLHQAIAAGSMETVKALVEAGAPLDARDTVFGGDALGWAQHFQHAEISAYLKNIR